MSIVETFEVVSNGRKRAALVSSIHGEVATGTPADMKALMKTKTAPSKKIFTVPSYLNQQLLDRVLALNPDGIRGKNHVNQQTFFELGLEMAVALDPDQFKALQARLEEEQISITELARQMWAWALSGDVTS